MAGASLVSYLLFDPRFCQELIKLEYRDAQHRSGAIDHFFSPGVNHSLPEDRPEC